nr:hypothetical protein [uncultured Sulfurimonas sp.]
MDEKLNMISSINELFSHIKEVQEETMQMSKDSMLMLGDFIEKNAIELDASSAKSLQYQDIISQQLSATIEAIDGVQKIINSENINSKNMQNLYEELSKILQIAREKRDSFSGKLGQKDDIQEIEFF